MSGLNGAPISVAVVGASGYVGGELVRLLLGHPGVRVVAATAREAAGKAIGEVHPNLAGVDLPLGALTETREAEVLFTALPNGETMHAIESLPDRPIVDVSADFRLRDRAEYSSYYGTEHACFHRVADFGYGLPELFRDRLSAVRHIAAPGCFATATILALVPIVAAGLDDSIVVNAVTGSSGSGAKPKGVAHHPFRADAYLAYEPFRHRHVPEIRQALADATGRDVDLVFQPHSGPFSRGIFVTAAIRLSSARTREEVREIYESFYADEPFVRLCDGSPNVKWVRGTNRCDIGVACDGRTAIVTAAIDNLMKGAASQAIQAFNSRFGFDERTGLDLFAAAV